MSKRYDLAVIGGGASGMMAALYAKTLDPKLSVILLERQPRVGKKLLATGNGRCNLSNLNADATRYHGSLSLLTEAFSRFAPKRVLEVFEGFGLYAAIEPDGRVYPASDQAASVLDALRLSMEERQIEVVTDCNVTRLLEGPRLLSSDGREILCRRAILCVGSPAAPKLGGSQAVLSLLRQSGHAPREFSPALTPIRTDTNAIRGLKGVKYRGAISLFSGDKLQKRETGEILFTEYGVSGIASMQLSGLAEALLVQKRPVLLRLEICQETPEALSSRLLAVCKACPARTLEDYLTGLVPKRLGQTVLKQAGIAPLSRACKTLTAPEIRAIAALLTEFPLTVTGTQGFEGAQTASGGVTSAFVDPKTLASRALPNLYLAGELLDIDGDCGGFNLQWAWASAMLAAQSAVNSLKGSASCTV